MKKFMQKIIILFVIIIPYIFWYASSTNVWIAPNFSQHFTSYFKNSDGGKSSVFVIGWVSSENTLYQNIRCIFYPNNNVPIEWCPSVNYWWQLRQIIKYLWYALLVLFIVIAWIRLLVKWSNADTVKQSLSSLLFIVLWSLLFFWSVWILWSVLKVWTTNWTTWLAGNIHWDSNSLLFFVLSFAKAFAFIAAIIMIVVYWFKVLSTADKSDKVKAWLKWLLNVIIALVIIKLIDYVYYIAQLPDLVTKATDLIIEIAKIMWFIIWALMMIMLFYAWFLYITDQWSSDSMKKATNIIIWILVTAVVIFALLLIIYQVVNEFA